MFNEKCFNDKQRMYHPAAPVLALLLALALFFCAGPLFVYAADRGPIDVEDGEYTVGVGTECETDTSNVKTPANVLVENGVATLDVEWYMKEYDTLEYDGVTYSRLEDRDNSVFRIPAPELGETVEVHAVGPEDDNVYQIHLYENAFREKGGVSWLQIIFWIAAAYVAAMLLFRVVRHFANR